MKRSLLYVFMFVLAFPMYTAIAQVDSNPSNLLFRCESVRFPMMCARMPNCHWDYRSHRCEERQRFMRCHRIHNPYECNRYRECRWDRRDRRCERNRY
jgi:hypothetical protein